jgi:hypothetical protein
MTPSVPSAASAAMDMGRGSNIKTSSARPGAGALIAQTMLTVLTQNSGFRRSAGCIRSELRTGLWRPTLEDEIGKPLADLGLLAKPTRLAIVPWLLVFFIVAPERRVPP